jgi:hypothetical protein
MALGLPERRPIALRRAAGPAAATSFLFLGRLRQLRLHPSRARNLAAACPIYEIEIFLKISPGGTR